MAIKNPIVEDLKEQLRKASLRADNEKEMRLRTEGELEKYENAEEEESRMVRDMRRRDDEYRQQLESEVAWMRRLIEFLCVPKEKMEILEKMRAEITMSGEDPRFRRNY